MKNQILFKVLIILIFQVYISGCTKDENPGSKEDNTEIKEPIKVPVLSISGYILDDLSKPVKDIKVMLNDNLIITNDSGYFKFDSLQNGVYIVSANSNFDNPAFTTFSDTIILQDSSFTYESVVLPQPLVLNNPIDLQPFSITLTWKNNNPDHTNFLEYKLFIGGSYYGTILNEENGTLVYIGTNLYDTVYTINNENYENAGGTIIPETEYFFRVYAYNNHEIVSASNIMKVVTPAEDNSDLPLHYELQPVINFAGANPIKGIDWDTNGNLWLLYYEEEGYVNGVFQAEGRLVNFNYNSGEYLDTIEISGFTQSPSGIAYDGDLLWVQMRSHTGKMDAYRIETGEIVKSYMLGSNQNPLGDIAKTDDGFVAVWNFHDYEIYNNLGGLIRRGRTPNSKYGADIWDLGIAFRTNEFWLIGSNTEKISIMDKYGVLIGIVETGLTFNLGWGGNCRLAIRDNKLAIATLSGVFIYNIVTP